MRKLAVNQPARCEERHYQRGAEEESQQVVRNGGCFHGPKVGQAFVPVYGLISFLQTTNMSNERVNFLFRKFFAVGGHLALAIHD